jgi:transposase
MYLPTLARANERRDWRIYFDFATLLIVEARKLYANDQLITLKFSEAVYIIDSTTIELCLSLFPWAKIPKKQASIKVHVILELHGNIPSFFAFSKGKSADVFFLDTIEFEPGAYYIFDRGYLDFGRFYEINQTGAFFVTRAKITWSFRRLYSKPIDRNAGIRCDQIVVQGRHHHIKKYPKQMRRIKYYDALTNRYYVFVTNNFELPATVIAELYKQRWQVELFFKWLKQHLSIKSFWGRSANAVKTQICIAIATYLLVVILKKQLHIERNTYEILQILSVSLFDKMPLKTILSAYELQHLNELSSIQANLWDY